MSLNNIFLLFCLIICISYVFAQFGVARPCMRDADCLAPNSTCNTGICHCAHGYVQVSHPERCLPVATSKNSPCVDDAQCTEAFLLGSYCDESQRCDCYPGYHFQNNLCLKANEVVKVKMLKYTLLLVLCISGALAQVQVPRGGTPLNNGQQGGYQPGGVQQGGNQGGYQGNQGGAGGDLSFPANPNAGASKGGQQTLVPRGGNPNQGRQPPHGGGRGPQGPGLVGGHVPTDESGHGLGEEGENNSESPIAFPSNNNNGGINDVCTSDSNCYVEGSYCKERSYCQCKEDRVAINDNKKCALIVKNIGGPCEDDMQCKGGLGLGSSCKSGGCQCVSNYHFTDLDANPRCAKTAKIGEICQDLGECTKKPDPSRMTCNSFCECKHPYTESSDKTECNGASSLSAALSLLLVAMFARFAH